MMLLNTKEDWQPEEADIIKWQRAYPAINVHQELMAMDSWCDANPTKRKTPQGIKKFVNSWLGRAQNQIYRHADDRHELARGRRLPNDEAALP